MPSLSKTKQSVVLLTSLIASAGLNIHNLTEVYPSQTWRLELAAMQHLIVFCFWLLYLRILSWMNPEEREDFGTQFKSLLILMLIGTFALTQYAVIQYYYSAHWRVSGPALR